MTTVNESFANALEQNIDAQAKFVDAWFESLEEALDEDDIREGIEGSSGAYEVWLDAIEQSYERSVDAFAGEEVGPREFRDIWLDAANEAMKEIGSTAAFAAMTGRTVEEALELRRVADEQAEDTLHTLGFATRSDVIEIGERMIELERRLHAVETKLDEIHESVTGE